MWPARALLGESPTWDPRSKRLIWVDIKARALHAYGPGEDTRRSWELPQRVCSIDVPPVSWPVPGDLEGQAFLGCGDSGFGWLGVGETGIDLRPMAALPQEHPRERFNDGKVGPDDRYWAGTMDDAEEDAAGRLYAFRADGTYRELDGGYMVTNGPAFAPGGSVVYHTDSLRQEIYAFDLGQNGTLTRKRLVTRFAEGEGRPDGMTTDNEGILWVAMWDGAKVERLSPEGARLGSIEIPTRRPTSCAFAEPGRSVLFVTSARVGLGERDPYAGGLFRVEME